MSDFEIYVTILLSIVTVCIIGAVIYGVIHDHNRQKRAEQWEHTVEEQTTQE